MMFICLPLHALLGPVEMMVNHLCHEGDLTATKTDQSMVGH
jgi:hypothetical protein